MLIAITFLLFVSLVGSEEAENFILSVPRIEYDKYTAEDLLCSNLNVSISFSNLNLGQIQANFLSSPLITCLDLKYNSINSIYAKAFEHLPNLKYLDLSGNSFNLQTILNDDFLEIETLILNSCSNNGDSRFEVEGSYPKLRKLFLERNYLYSIESTHTDNLPSLTHLYLSDNNIDRDSFRWLPDSIQYLDLSRNELPSLTLKNLPNLEKLFIDNQKNNRLTAVNFENLMSLKYLSSKSNRISDVSFSTFKNATSLINLDISDNQIKYIMAGSFDSMKNLQFLNLSNNYLEIVQAGTFDQLRNLETLILEKNLITMFPVIGQEMKLQYLLLNCNKIRNIIGGTFSRMPYLESLLLHDNELSYIDQEAFKGLKNLKLLTLSNNQLSSMPANWMVPLTNLNKLDLIGNSFGNFSDLALSESSGLQNLYLSKQIEFINAQSLFGVPDNVTIDLRENIIFVEQCNKKNSKYSREYYG